MADRVRGPEEGGGAVGVVSFVGYGIEILVRMVPQRYSRGVSKHEEPTIVSLYSVDAVG
jgi:hypothetical protein